MIFILIEISQVYDCKIPIDFDLRPIPLKIENEDIEDVQIMKECSDRNEVKIVGFLEGSSKESKTSGTKRFCTEGTSSPSPTTSRCKFIHFFHKL